MLVLEKRTGENKTKQLHAISVCFRNEIITRDPENVLPELNTAEIHISVLFLKPKFGSLSSRISV